MFTPRNVIITIALFAVLGIGINAFAHGGMGWGGGWGHHRGGMQYQEGCPRANGDQMSTEAYQEFKQKRDAFFSDTQELRDSLFEKEKELQSELAKDEPDVAQASQLQQDISDLRSQFDQKRIEHMVEMRKLNPNAGRGFKSGGPGMGYGKRGGGNCRW